MNLNTFRRVTNQWFGNSIIQVSPIRSGSTLVFNILREVFPNRSIRKQHYYRDSHMKNSLVVTYRHPLDCIASSILRYDLKPTNEVLEQHMAEFDKNGIWDVLALKKHPNVLMLRYEDFVYNFEVIFNALEAFFDIEISIEKRKLITGKYQIEAVEESVASKSTFSEYDTTTHWHGKHISQYKGKPYYYREFFKDDQIENLMNNYKNFITHFDYN